MKHWLWATFIMLSGCISTVPEDLEYRSVEAVSWRDQLEMPGRDASPLLGLVPRHMLEKGERSALGEDRPPELLLKVEFQSSENLLETYVLDGFNLGIYAKPCSEPKNFPQLANTFVYWRGLNISFLSDDVITPAIGADRRIIYYFFIHGRRSERVRDGRVWPSYDVTQTPSDLCFYVAGGKAPFGQRSNLAVIPQAAVEDALRRASPDLLRRPR